MADTTLIQNPETYRHRWEMPLIWLSVIVTLATFLIGLALLTMDEAILRDILEEETDTVLDLAAYAPMLLVLPAIVFVYRYFMAAQARANGLRVGPRQMPELWEMYRRLGERMGMRYLPRLYVTNGNGVVNAYALSCNVRVGYVVVHSEIALLLPTQPEAVEFVLAHELAHHRLRHVSLWRIVAAVIPNFVVPLGLSATRAQEYSADRLALAACGHHEKAMKLLAAGPWMVGDVNAEAWDEQCADERGEFFVRAANVMSSHAVLVKRYKALQDIQAKGFCCHGDMA